MNLLILPGAGNPDLSPLYAEVYRTLSAAAQDRGFTTVEDSVRWPGQMATPNQEGRATLSLAGAVETALRAAMGMPEGSFAIVARSFGCTVALKVAARLIVEGRPPGKVILWGPPSFWSLWELFVRDFCQNREISAQKGVMLSASYFHGLEPVESLLRGAPLPTTVAAGALDKLCPPPFIEYLRTLCADNPLVEVKPPVVGAGHEVTAADGAEVVAGYGEALFA